MTVSEIYQSDKRYEEWGPKKFEKYYKILLKKIEEKKARIELDNIAVAEHLKNFPRENRKGYPDWDTHAAKNWLEIDVANKKHEQMKPSQLRKTRSDYKKFPKDVFTKRVHREISKQKAAAFWAEKRNKKGMKKYLKDVAERKKQNAI